MNQYLPDLHTKSIPALGNSRANNTKPQANNDQITSKAEAMPSTSNGVEAYPIQLCESVVPSPAKPVGRSGLSRVTNNQDMVMTETDVPNLDRASQAPALEPFHPGAKVYAEHGEYLRMTRRDAELRHR